MASFEGVVGVIFNTQRHLAKSAPSFLYWAHLSYSPSKPGNQKEKTSGDVEHEDGADGDIHVVFLPWVVVSPLVPASGTTPLSTLMPTTMPLSLRYWVKGLPLSVFWYMVSWKRMTPPMHGLMRSSAVKRSWRYSLLFSSVFSALML